VVECRENQKKELLAKEVREQEAQGLGIRQEFHELEPEGLWNSNRELREGE
jgi:hypothetical protein